MELGKTRVELSRTTQALEQQKRNLQKVAEQLAKCQKLKDKFAKSRDEWRTIARQSQQLLQQAKSKNKEPKIIYVPANDAPLSPLPAGEADPGSSQEVAMAMTKMSALKQEL